MRPTVLVNERVVEVFVHSFVDSKAKNICWGHDVYDRRSFEVENNAEKPVIARRGSMLLLLLPHPSSFSAKSIGTKNDFPDCKVTAVAMRLTARSGRYLYSMADMNLGIVSSPRMIMHATAASDPVKLRSALACRVVTRVSHEERQIMYQSTLTAPVITTAGMAVSMFCGSNLYSPMRMPAQDNMAIAMRNISMPGRKS